MLTAEQAAKNISGLVGSVCEGEPVVITSGGHKAVLIGEDDYRGLIETLNLLQDPEMAADLDRTRRTPVSEMEVWEGPESDSEWKRRFSGI